MADVKMINGFTGTVMYVPAEKLEEYKAAGHVPADAPLQEDSASYAAQSAAPSNQVEGIEGENPTAAKKKPKTGRKE